MPTDEQRDRQTDMTKLTVVYHNFVNAPYKNTIHTGATAFNA
jgi:hypothetical protein